MRRLPILSILILVSVAGWLAHVHAQNTGQSGLAGGGGAFLPSYSSGTVTGSISATTLCNTTNCPAGTYLVTVYQNEVGGSGCTTVGTGANSAKVSYVNPAGVTQTAVSVNQTISAGAGFGIAGMNFTTAGTGAAYGLYVLKTNGTAVSGSDVIQISSTVVACGTPGPWTGFQMFGFVTRLN